MRRHKPHSIYFDFACIAFIYVGINLWDSYVAEIPLLERDHEMETTSLIDPNPQLQYNTRQRKGQTPNEKNARVLRIT